MVCRSQIKGGNLIVNGVGELLVLEGVEGVVGVVGVWGLVGVVGTLLQLGDLDFQAVRRHFVRLFWNQILIWFSVRPSLSAKICLSWVERYWDTWNAFSSSSICVPENVARPFFCDFFFSSSTDWWMSLSWGSDLGLVMVDGLRLGIDVPSGGLNIGIVPAVTLAIWSM